MNRKIFKKVQENAAEFCTYDDYNWDWTMVYLQNKGLLPRALMMPSKVLVKHIGFKEGMHSEHEAEEKYGGLDPPTSGRLSPPDTHFSSVRRFTGEAKPFMPVEHEYGFGGWGHPKDHEHCLKILS